jgi:hypothetical protein
VLGVLAAAAPERLDTDETRQRLVRRWGAGIVAIALVGGRGRQGVGRSAGGGPCNFSAIDHDIAAGEKIDWAGRLSGDLILRQRDRLDLTCEEGA